MYRLQTPASTYTEHHYHADLQRLQYRVYMSSHHPSVRLLASGDLDPAVFEGGPSDVRFLFSPSLGNAPGTTGATPTATAAGTGVSSSSIRVKNRSRPVKSLRIVPNAGEDRPEVGVRGEPYGALPAAARSSYC